MNKKEKQLIFKICVLGDLKVGKTSFLKRLYLDKFSINYHNSIPIDLITKNIDIKLDNDKIKTITLHIFDIIKCMNLDIKPQDPPFEISNNGNNKSLLEILDETDYFNNTDGYIIMYDIGRKSTFDNIPIWIEQIKSRSTKSNYSIMILANKIDKLDNETKIEFNQLIENGKLYSNNLNIPFFQISNKTSLNINESLNLLVYEIYNKNKNNNQDNLEDNNNNNNKNNWCNIL